VKREEQILVILNPTAHGGRAGNWQKRIASLSRRIVIHRTEGEGDARRAARQGIQDGFRVIVAAGGDGTINEVVNGLAQTKDVTLGILPVGTMNVFATELGLPANDLPAAWRVITEGKSRSIDFPRANGQYFVQLAGAGLDAEVVRQTTPDFKRALGPVSYLLTLAQVAARRPPEIHVIPVDGPRRRGCFVLVGNGRFYGGPFPLFKEARLDDGLLDVIIFQNQSHWDILRYVQAIAFGNHPELPDVEYFQTCGLQLHSDDSVPVEIDGEWTGTLPCTIQLSGRQLTVLVPAAQGELPSATISV